MYVYELCAHTKRGRSHDKLQVQKEQCGEEEEHSLSEVPAPFIAL